MDTNSNSQSEELSPGQHLDLNTFDTCQEKIGLTDKDLATIKLKDLNDILKKSDLKPEEKKRIRTRKRTLKNRGYAAQTRLDKEKAKNSLKDEIKNSKV